MPGCVNCETILGMSSTPPCDRPATVREILRHRVSAIIRAGDALIAEKAIGAAVEGGFRLVEFTLTTPAALRLITKFAAERELLVGAGTVLTPDDARRAVDAGARFLVSPVCDPPIIAEAARLGVVSIPGCFTPTEMLAAHRAGADLIKLFPAPPDVAEYITAIRGPLPFLKVFPTAGVSAENVVAVLKAGAAGAGFVRSLFDPKDLAQGDYGAIRRRAEDIHRRLNDAGLVRGGGSVA